VIVAWVFACAERASDEMAGAMLGAVTDDEAVRLVPAATPEAKSIDAFWAVDDARLRDPPDDGIVCVYGADEAVGVATGVVATDPPEQLAMAIAPETTSAPTVRRVTRKEPSIEFLRSGAGQALIFCLSTVRPRLVTALTGGAKENGHRVTRSAHRTLGIDSS
jgi:hypothetical protein